MGMAVDTWHWTLDDLHRLPDDGNKYELVRGELFVTPAPVQTHETILARLSSLLAPYVAAQHLGFVYHPRAVIEFKGSEVEPDLMVRQPETSEEQPWVDAPIPILVVEVASRTTARRDRQQKRQLYLDIGIPEYWIVDRFERRVTVVRQGEPDRDVSDAVVWHPAGAAEGARIPLDELFGGR